MGVDFGRAYVFHTPWFLGLMGLLLVNLCLCSWEKSYIALTLYKKRNFKSNPNFYRSASHAVGFPWSGSEGELKSKLKKTYTIVAEKDGSFYAQKGLFGRTGATIIHIGLLWTMMAGFYRIVADDLGFGIYDSSVILAEGQTGVKYFTRIDRLKEPTASNLKEMNLPFQLRALDFNAEYFPHSTVAKKFSAIIELTDPNNKKTPFIHEVTMATPLIYNGYKITQNSFSPNENIIRGKFRITDNQTGKISEVDAIPGDPVPIRIDNYSDAFLQVNGLENGKKFHIVNLHSGEILDEGNIETEQKLPLPLNLGPYQSQLNKSKYSFMVAALFPNFVLDNNNQPTTENEEFINPAILTIVFKKGRFNGYAWIFNHKEAQAIVGQPHPELELEFLNYKNTAQTSPSSLLDYQVEVRIKEKASGKVFDNLWVKPGELSELNASPSLINSAIVSTTDANQSHAGTETSGTTATKAIAKTDKLESSTGSSSDKFSVTFLGPVTGNVTIMGVMKDPSVIWMYIGCFIIVFGTLVAFFFVYRETWAYYDQENQILYMATAVRGTSPGAHREFDRLVKSIQNDSPPPSSKTNAAPSPA